MVSANLNMKTHLATKKYENEEKRKCNCTI